MTSLITERREFGPFNRCIYCGDKENLSNEHIMPASLSGRWELLKASCERHRDITHRIEGVLGRNAFLPVRHQHNYPTSHKDRPITVDVAGSAKEVETEEDLEKIVTMDLDDVAPVILMPEFEWSEFMKGKVAPLSLDDRKVKWWATMKFEKGVGTKYGIKTLTTPDFNLAIFSRFLAKVAHCYAIAMLGVDGFKPWLIPIIDEENDEKALMESSLFIGGTKIKHEVIDPAAPPDSFVPLSFHQGDSKHDFLRAPKTHSIGHQIRKIQGKDCVVVAIKLFSYMEPPGYLIIVGEATTKNSQSHLSRLLRKFRRGSDPDPASPPTPSA